MSLRFTLHDSSKKSDGAVKPVWFGSSPSCEKELPRRSRVFTWQRSPSDPEGEGQTLRQQMLLTQGVMDLLYRRGPGLQQQPVQQTPTVAQNSTGHSERLTMDTKWIPAAPLPDWKSWNNRARELAGFKGWLEKFASWLCLVHDSCAQELKEAMNLPYPAVTVSQDQAIRSRRLFHLLQQSFSGYSGVDTVVKSQIAFYGIQEANGFELLRLLRREFSLMSRPEALQYREACLKYTVKKSERHLLMDILREIGAEIEGFHSILEASLIAGQLTDLHIGERGRAQQEQPHPGFAMDTVVKSHCVVIYKKMHKRINCTQKCRGSRGAPFGEGTLSPLRRYLKPLPKGGRGGRGG